MERSVRWHKWEPTRLPYWYVPTERPVFNTDWNWQVLTGESYSSLDDFVVPGYYAADRGERFDANNYPWGWQTEQEAPGFDWKQARNLDAAADKGTRDRGGRLLVPRSIPQMEMREVSAGDINLPLTVAPHTRTSVLIDRDSPHQCLSPPDHFRRQGG